MEGYLDDVDAMSSRQFFLAARRLADSLSYGTDHSPFRGSGIEYVQTRPYQFGDPVRAIDWRVTARTGKFHVKEYESPKRLNVYLLVDTSASMVISSIRRSKYSLAVQIVAGIALAALDRVSPVGVLGVGDRDLVIEPSLSKNRIMQWLVKLRRFRYDETTQLGRRITELAPSLSNRAMIFVLSDMHDTDAMRVLKRLAQEHDVVVLHLEDPAELGLRGAGFFRSREAETGEPRVTHGRARWTDRLSIADELKRTGIDQLHIRTDEPFMHRLRHFLASRNLLGRGTR